MTSSKTRGSPRIAVVFSRFPAWRENFVVGDFIALDRAGFRIEIFTLLGQQGPFHQPETEVFRGRVHRASLLLPRLLLENIKAWCRPVAWRLLFQVIAGSLACPVELVKNCAVFPRAIYFAYVIRQKAIEHVHAAWATYPTTVAWIVSELTRIPFSFSSHAHDIYMTRSLLGEKIERAKFIVTCAETNRRALLDIAGADAGSKIHVHRHGSDLERFRPAGRSRRKSEDIWQILACGILDDYKGFEHLIDACALLKRQGYKFECRIIGEGPRRGNLLQQIDQSGLTQQVHIVPPMIQAKLVEWYRAADVFVHPSVMTKEGRWDVIPNVLVEAMASGTPVISTFIAGIQELVQNGKNGILVPPEDPTALANAVTSLMQDRSKREELVKAAQDTVAKAYDRRKNAVGLVETFATHVSPATGYSVKEVVH
jgi:glycosyltransferase involved in cell wall biosynthesis